jgi:hypothetical protein
MLFVFCLSVCVFADGGLFNLDCTSSFSDRDSDLITVNYTWYNVADDGIVSKISNETNVSVFLENRSNNKFIVSTPEEVINFSQKYLMTIDIPQLYIACQFSEEIFKNTLKKINWENIKELHLGGLVKKLKSEGAKRNMTLVAQQLTKGMMVC